MPKLTKATQEKILHAVHYHRSLDPALIEQMLVAPLAQIGLAMDFLAWCQTSNANFGFANIAEVVARWEKQAKA